MSDSAKLAVPPFKVAADVVAEKLDADVLIVNAPIYRPLALRLLELCKKRNRRPNLLLVLVTNGGDAHTAYRIARCFQRLYTNYTLFLTGSCKSAGTLVAIGASHLVVGETGELGPLDVQMTKPDELFVRQSGLTASAALSSLHESAFQAFEHFFLNLVAKSGNTITTRTATHVAVQLTSGLFAPIYEHVDPMNVGESGRALEVAQQYGRLLQAEGGNLKSGALERLTSGYASHDFVIDLMQIETLFNEVREPESEESELARTLGKSARDEVGTAEKPLAAFLSTESKNEDAGAAEELGGPQVASEASEDNDGQQEPSRSADEGGAVAGGEPKAPAQAGVAPLKAIRRERAG